MPPRVDDRAVRILLVLALVCAAAAAGGRIATAAAPRATPVPILEYHVIGDPPPGAPYPALYVAEADFRAQLTWLERHGYHAVTLDRVWRAWHGRGTLPEKPVALTFDDGYPQDVDVVRPLLRRLRWPAMLNLQIGNLVPARVRSLIAAGWEIDVHTFTHPDLTLVGPRQLRHEISDARTWIRNVFHRPADFFCYPAGRYDTTVIGAVRAAGYLGATTTQFGLARPADLFTLDRVRVNGSDGVAGLAAKLRSLDEPA